MWENNSESTTIMKKISFLEKDVTLRKNLVQKAQELHATYPTSSAALGRLLTAGVMMGLMYKNNEKIKWWN